MVSRWPARKTQTTSAFPAPHLPLQAKPEVGRTDDPLEHEADRVADQVIRMPATGVSVAATPPRIQRECAVCGTEQERLRRQPASPHASAGEAPGIVHDVLRSPGRPLDTATRGYFEPRFRRDFSQVRVHTDAQAAHAAKAIDARAYAIGNDVVFAAGQFQPSAVEGQRLLAHELAHVVSQRHAAPFIRRAPAQGAREGGDFRCGGDDPCTLQTTNNTYPTWAGKFIVDGSCVTQSEGEGGNGVNLTMRFEPNDHADARQIVFVQTAQSKTGGKPVSPYDDKSDKEKDAARKRIIPDKQPGEGTHIDQGPSSRTPVMGMRDVAGKSGLGDFEQSTPPTISTPGFHYTDKGSKPQAQDASMHDCPSLPRVAGVAQQQILETAALAVSGAQQGIYYGSVRWGWTMGAHDTVANGLPINVVSKDAPSSVFAEAAKRWNSSLTSDGKASIALPQNMYTVGGHGVDLWDDPGKKKKLGTLAKDTIVGVTDQADPKHADWQNIVVVSGPLTGRTGWVEKSGIKPYAGPALPGP